MKVIFHSEVLYSKEKLSAQLDISPIDKKSVERDIPVEKIDSKNDIPARILFLKLQRVEAAKIYEIQIRPQNKTWLNPYTVRTDREKLRLRVTPGLYEIRTRSLDAKNKKGSWLVWKKFVVPFKDLIGFYPAANTELLAKGELKELLTFEWEKNKEAKAYRYKLYDEKKNLLRHVVTKQNWISTTLEVKKNYFWSINSLTSAEEPDNLKLQKLIPFRISEPDKELSPVSMKLAENPLADKYQFELVKLINADESSEPSIYESREAVFKARLSPGEYELRVRTVYENKAVTGWGKPTRFVIAIPNPVLQTPINNEQIEAFDDVNSKVTFKWKKSRWAEKYLVFVYNENEELVHKQTTSESELEVALPHKQKYKWFVRALFERQKTRDVASLSEKTKQEMGRFEIDEYIKLSLGQSEEPSQLYAWGRGILSDAAYKAENYDNINRIKQSVIASTGELALGYWHRKTSYGGLLTGALSGIDVAGNSMTYTQVSALLGIRKSFENDTRLRIWFGPSIKETPEILISGSTNSVEIKKIKTVGPNLLGAYLNSFNEKWGYQAYVGLFYGMQGMSSPNGLEQSKYFSYFSSLYLTYKWSTMTTALVGYTYQVDEAGYKSADKSGNDNHVLYTGNYLSFSLIMGLQEVQK